VNSEELQNFYSTSNIITVIRSRRLRLAEHAVCKGEMTNVIKILPKNLKGGDHLGDPGIDGG
jgi:hypothetical protein